MTRETDSPVGSGTVFKLDPREQHFRLPVDGTALSIFLRRLSSARPPKTRRVVLYLHGATFPSAVSIAYRFDGVSWRDALNQSGFDVWGLDFLGFGESDRYPGQHRPPGGVAPLCGADDASRQLATALRFIVAHEGVERISLISHSWGSMPAGRIVAAHPQLIDRWVLFAPLAAREPARYQPALELGAWRLVSLEDQWLRFVEDLPPNETPVLERRTFDAWGQAYLDSDRSARSHAPPAVNTPLGPLFEILKAWRGELAWEPERIECPVALIRGEWDGLVTDADASRLLGQMSRATHKRDIKISRGTHLLHLEKMRAALWRESIAFLEGESFLPDDRPAI